MYSSDGAKIRQKQISVWMFMEMDSGQHEHIFVYVLFILKEWAQKKSWLKQLELRSLENQHPIKLDDTSRNSLLLRKHFWGATLLDEEEEGISNFDDSKRD